MISNFCVSSDSEARAVHKALAWVSEEHLKHAAILARRFQRRGIMAAVGAPLTWLTFKRNILHVKFDRSSISKGDKHRSCHGTLSRQKVKISFAELGN